MTFGLRLHVVHRPLGEEAALVQHRDPVGDLLDEVHVVLDDDHRAVLRDLEQQPAGGLALVRRSSRRRARRAAGAPGSG